MSNVSYKSCTLLWYAKKEKHEIFVNFHKNSYLSAQIKYAQNWYTTVQVDLTHPLLMYQINVPRVTQKANKTCIHQYLFRTVRIGT